MTIRTNTISIQPVLNNFTAMRLNPSVAAEEVMDFDGQSLWHDTDMHSDRDVLEYPTVKEVYIELAR